MTSLRLSQRRGTTSTSTWTRLAERHLLGLGLAGVAEQGVAGSLVFGRVDAIGAHGGLHHCHAALLLHRPVSGRWTQGDRGCVNLSGDLSNESTFNRIDHWISQPTEFYFTWDKTTDFAA